MTRIYDAVISMILRAAGRIHRPKFREWLTLENKKDKIIQAIAKRENDFPDLVISYVAIAFRLPLWLVEAMRWDLLLYLFILHSAKCAPSKQIPLMMSSPSKKKEEAWHYDGRAWYMYSHIIAQKYGWDLERIENLDVDDALAYIQEILTDEQLDREFLWSMSEKSYIYNYQTKSGKPNPLERPYWMLEKVSMPKKVMMPKSMLPAGVDYSAVGEYAPKELEH